ncbi:MAG: hypothetical protein KatS3mg098_209 [Candidatus Parcubacteria bacterium]|nr:MAG: hypothetical protein KatS3mg098_209 [Candidatus Parcubacteria bacterium]
MGAVAFLLVVMVSDNFSQAKRVGERYDWRDNYFLREKNNFTKCVQIATPALNPRTGECVVFSNPCNVPTGWKIISGSSCSYVK